LIINDKSTKTPSAEQLAGIAKNQRAGDPTPGFRPLRAKPGKKNFVERHAASHLAKDALHGASLIVVVAIDCSWALPTKTVAQDGRPRTCR
jgi:hypothetical protein